MIGSTPPSDGAIVLVQVIAVGGLVLVAVWSLFRRD